MNLRQKFTLSLLLTIVLGRVAFAQVVDIPDSGLRSEIQRRLNLPSGEPITREQMRQLTYVDADYLGITDLSGLEYAIDLEGLELRGNALTDISQIASLAKLTLLILVDNNIEDLTPLANLAFLRELNLRGNPLSDLGPLSGLTKLEYLDLGWCRIEDVRPLANLTNLKSLQLNDNRIVDPSPLKNLVELTELEIQTNYILDHSALDALQLDNFRYDQACELPPLSPHPRITERSHPSVFTPWSGPSWPSILNRPDLSGFEKTAKHDLWFSTPESQFALSFIETPTGFTLAGELNSAIQTRDEFFSLNPNMIFIVDIPMHAVGINAFPQDWPYWLRYPNGDIVINWQYNQGLVDFTHPHIQERIVQQALAVDRCGLFDGIHFDWWHETGGVLEPAYGARQYKHLGNEAEQRARDNILERIRAQTRPDFLIMGNTNRRKIPRTGKHINGGFMETELPGIASGALLEKPLTEVESALSWLERNLREPHINALEGASIRTESPDSPNNLRWMRVFTTMNLTHSDGYVLFQSIRNHDHYWYDFWDADLGRPVGEKGQRYQGTDGLYIREFTNGWAVYNHSGAEQTVTLPELASGVASGLEGTEHTLPNLDGEMYLRVKPANPADVNEDGVVNILDLTLVAQGFGTDSLEGDVNGDGVVNVFDLVQVAGALGGGGAAPSAYSLDPSIISAADVERWLAQAQVLGVGDANFQQGIHFLEQLLAALTPKETMLLPNYPNPFNPETWIPYRLAREAEVAITIYDTKGTLLRRLALGDQAAGYYAERGKAAYWDGRNEGGEAVASGIYIYQFRAGDYAASRRMVIVK